MAMVSARRLVFGERGRHPYSRIVRSGIGYVLGIILYWLALRFVMRPA